MKHFEKVKEMLDTIKAKNNYDTVEELLALNAQLLAKILDRLEERDGG